MNQPPKFSLHDYLEHIAEAAGLILEYTRGMSKEDFLKDRKTQQAVLMNFMTIGEAAVLLKNDHSAFIAKHAEVPWNKMRGMRNILVDTNALVVCTSSQPEPAFPASVDAPDRPD